MRGILLVIVVAGCGGAAASEISDQAAADPTAARQQSAEAGLPADELPNDAGIIGLVQGLDWVTCAWQWQDPGYYTDPDSGAPPLPSAPPAFVSANCGVGQLGRSLDGAILDGIPPQGARWITFGDGGELCDQTHKPTRACISGEPCTAWLVCPDGEQVQYPQALAESCGPGGKLYNTGPIAMQGMPTTATVCR